MIGTARRRGAVALLGAAAAMLLLGFAGLAIDLTRAWMVRTRLKSAVDAAALLAARSIAETTRDQGASAIFWANFNQGRVSGGNYLGAVVTGPTIAQVASNQIRVSASARVSTTLFSVLVPTVVAFGESSVAQRAGTGLELAIVIDTTYSMSLPADGGGTKLAAAQAATRSMLDILYGSRDIQPNLWVSVVPSSVAINIGTHRAGWLTGAAPAYTNGFTWSGCVEARRGGEDITETSPAAAPFRRFFWADTYKGYGRHYSGTPPQGQTSRCASSQAYAADAQGARWCMGDNDWGATQAVRNTNTFLSEWRTNPSLPNSGGANFSPNNWCPTSPILPLTASRATVQASVDALTAGPGLGTVLPAGIQGAWFTLSPQWQSAWGLGNAPNGNPLPMAYGTREMNKAVVLLSDGDNNWYGSQLLSYLGESASTTVAPSNQTTPTNQTGELFYMAYGRTADHPAGGTWLPASPSNFTTNSFTTNQQEADRRLDARFATLCARMKARGIVLFVIGFEVAEAAHRANLQACASTPSSQYYFESPSAAQLQGIFAQIANQLAGLRLTE